MLGEETLVEQAPGDEDAWFEQDEQTEDEQDEEKIVARVSSVLTRFRMANQDLKGRAA